KRDVALRTKAGRASTILRMRSRMWRRFEPGFEQPDTGIPRYRTHILIASASISTTPRGTTGSSCNISLTIRESGTITHCPIDDALARERDCDLARSRNLHLPGCRTESRAD